MKAAVPNTFKSKSPAWASRVAASQSEHDSPGVLDGLLDLLQEEHGLSAVNYSMVVGERHVHYGPSFYLVSDADGSVLGGVHSEDGALRRVDNRSSHHGSKNAAVGDGEGASSHVLQRDLILASLLAKLDDLFLHVMHLHVLAVSQNGHDEALGGRNGDANVDEVSVNHVLSIDDGVDDGLVLEGKGCSLDESRHESKLDVVLLEEEVPILLSQLHVARHVDLVEGGQHGVGVLGLLEPVGDSDSHSAHGHSRLAPRTSDAFGRGL
mmetsp:Transcript_3365/g.5630  ORF Transcript_3365/g.5630 Transcript_3365/m.5630 type:complete len:266 (-) Transcript_3365:648-1445(-)